MAQRRNPMVNKEVCTMYHIWDQLCFGSGPAYTFKMYIAVAVDGYLLMFPHVWSLIPLFRTKQPRASSTSSMSSTKGWTSTGSQRLSTISRIYPLWERSCHKVSRLHFMASPRPTLRVRGRCPLAKGAPDLMSSHKVRSIYSGVSPHYSGFSPIRLGICCVKWPKQVTFCHSTAVSYKVEEERLGNIALV